MNARRKAAGAPFTNVGQPSHALTRILQPRAGLISHKEDPLPRRVVSKILKRRHPGKGLAGDRRALQPPLILRLINFNCLRL